MIRRGFHLELAVTSRLSSLRFKSLKLLQIIIDEGSVRKAADVLCVTQPAASSMLQEVEQALGLELFARSRSGMTPTPALVSLLQRLKVIDNELLALHEDANALQSRDRQTYRLGVLPRSMQNYMPQVLAKIVEQHRGLEFSVTEATSDILLRELSDNRLDCVVARFTRDAVVVKDGGRPFRFQVLYEEGMCVVAGKRHPLSNRKRITLRDTLDWGWTLPPKGSVTRNLLVDEFLYSGISPPVPVIECANFFSNLSLVEQGTLLTVVPASAARKYATLHGISILDLKLQTPLPPISLIWREGSPLQGPFAVLRDELLRNCGT
ncbi:hypothetical protein CR155_09065 [Pollutimonas nitritireducens]|uniref:HTH lysR-type domain-containing protein n=1 Tax=Pollutimonas nitritireducens TaxID=2045209 RepID=A0A2N4UGV2_9BURK|nr:hypothetical protein CR155_09065 [Pollutimonas nitritireducens]